jgi:redox-sensing transcriptional repressor
LEKNHADIGFITTTKEAAQNVANMLMDSGIKAIWNFAPVDVFVRKDVKIENVNLSDSLYVLSYRMRNELES